MAFRSRKTTYDSYTPSVSSRRTSRNGALYRISSKETIQSYNGSISNSSVHTTSTAATRKDLFDYPERGPGGVASISHRKSFHSLEKPTFRFRNQSQSTVGTIRQAGSARSSTTISISEEIRSLNIPSSEDEDESLAPSTPPRSSVYNLSEPDSEPSIPTPVNEYPTTAPKLPPIPLSLPTPSSIYLPLPHQQHQDQDQQPKTK